MLLCWLTLNTRNKLGRGNHLVQILFTFYFMFLFEMKFKRLFISEVHPAYGAFKGLHISVRSYVPFKVSQMIISFTTDFTVIQIVTQMQAFVLCVWRFRSEWHVADATIECRLHYWRWLYINSKFCNDCCSLWSPILYAVSFVQWCRANSIPPSHWCGRFPSMTPYGIPLQY